MLGLPESTEVRQRINKTAIYRKFELNTSQQASFDEDISSLVIVNEVSSQTIKLSGSDENAFFVLEVQLKKMDYNKKNIERLSKLIDQNLLLVLRFEDFARLAVFKAVFYESEWKPLEEIKLKLTGLTFDDLWENVIREVGCIETTENVTLDEQISINLEREKINKQIAVLESKMNKEKQPNKKMALFEEIKELKRELEK